MTIIPIGERALLRYVENKKALKFGAIELLEPTNYEETFEIVSLGNNNNDFKIGDKVIVDKYAQIINIEPNHYDDDEKYIIAFIESIIATVGV